MKSSHTENKHIEVEIKLPLKTPKNVLEEQLLKEGFIKNKILRECDTYFNSKFYDFRKKDEALRVRDCENLITGDKKSELTYKGPKLDKVSMTRKELECEFTSPEIMIEILKSLGFDDLYEVDKTRIYYIREDMTICLDEVKGLGDFMEMEIITEESGKEAALDRIIQMLHKLGYSIEDTTRNSYLSMLMNTVDI